MSKKSDKIKIAVYALAKNEMKFIDKWLVNMEDGADYVCIMDTGSTDGTWEHLNELAKTDKKLVLEQKTISPWRFDAARNENMKMVPKDADICVCTDPDELLDKGWADLLRNYWQKGKTKQVYYTYVWKSDEKGNPLVVFNYAKIHSNDGTWYWKYQVHEDLLNLKPESLNLDNSINLYGAITLRHYPDNTKQRDYTPQIEARVAEYNDNISKMYLGIDLAGHTDDESQERAIKVFGEIVENREDTTLRNETERAYASYSVGLINFRKGKTNEALKWMKKATVIDPTFRDAYLDLAKLYCQFNCFAQAKEVLDDCLKKSVRHGIWIENSLNWTTPVLPQLMAFVCANMGYKDEALMYINEALRQNPKDEESKNLKKAIETLPDIV